MRAYVCIVIACARLAVAEPAASEADRLFREGIALFDAGKFDEACARFEQSIVRDPHAIGTLMNLGRCNERRGKVATALKRYQEAYDRASQANATAMRDAAQVRIAALTPQVPVIVVKRSAPPLDGEKLVIDDQVIASDTQQLGLDPGPHALVLTAPGRLPYETTLTAQPAQTITVELPVLQAPKPGTTVHIRSSSRRTIGMISTFAGAGIAIVGGGVALYAKRDYDKQFADPDGPGPRVANCSPQPDSVCNAVGQSRVERDNNLGTTASVIGAIGLAAVATGVVLWITAPGQLVERTTIAPVATANAAGVMVTARF